MNELLNLPFIKLFLSKEYRLFWIAAFFSNIGMWALIYGRLWLMRTLTDSETMLGLVSSANLTPVLLLSIFGGVMADKYNRLKILRLTRLMFCFMTFLTGVLIYFKIINPTILILISLVTGVLLAFDIPSRSSMIAKLVDKKFLPVAISMYSIVFGVSGIIGPSLFHPIVKFIGLEGLFFIIGSSYLLTFITLKKMNYGLHEPVKSKSLSTTKELILGWNYLIKSPVIFTVVFIGFFFGLTAGSYDVLLPAITTDFLNGDSEIYGKLLLYGGISGLLSTSILILFGQKLNQYFFYFGFGLVSSVTLIIMGTNFGINNIFFLFAAISFAKGFFNTMGTTIIQSNVKEEFRGRIMSISQLSWGSVAIGAILVGYLAEFFSIKFAFNIIGTSSLVIIILGGAITSINLLRKR
ncbi:MAG: MFS transporter [Chloroflexota bacterium]|nr:MFS transporter [Chloroflexota bacterium]